MKKSIFTLWVCLLPFLAFTQESIKTIIGTVSDDFGVLKDVNIAIKGREAGVPTDSEGKYEIQAKVGDVLVFSRMGLLDTEILVEDVTRVLNVTMFEKVEQLKEVTVTKETLKSQQELAIEYHVNPKVIRTAFGYWDADATSFSLRIIDKEQINPGAFDLARVIQGRFPGVRISRSSDPSETIILLRALGSLNLAPAAYDIDGLLTDQYPAYIDPQNIERLALVSSMNGLSRYGTYGRGGVIIINTKVANFQPKDANGALMDTARIKHNMYFDHALEGAGISNFPNYLQELYASDSEGAAIKSYAANAGKYSGSFFFFLDAYSYFFSKWKNSEFAGKILTENWKVFENDPVALKSLAYVYQATDQIQKANGIYKEVFRLRPHYVQSYLDLANSYREDNEYQKAAAMYVRYGYLLDANLIADEKMEFTTIMERELNNLIILKGKELLSKRDLKKLTLDDEFDGTRLVFEWANSEAEFELQFVNPQDRYFSWKHSLRDSAERIKDEKAIGYSSVEYLIDEALKGNWKVNIKYLGNKSLTATYLKTTIYHNYGRASQHKETKVFKLSLRNVNQQLFVINNGDLVVSN